MTLDEAIKHAEEVAEEKAEQAWEAQLQEEYSTIKSCKECAEEHRQLAEWLKDYKRLKEQEPRWIPVSERLPESDVDVLTQYSDYSMSVDFRTASSSGWFWAEYDLPIAWMPLPAPYEPQESEDKE